VQKAVLDVVSRAQEPMLIIIEESMGGGKTESALLATEILMHEFGASGLAFLLPTQATSNAMFARVEQWLSSLLGDQSDASAQDLHLLHGKAALNEDYASLPVWHAGWMGDYQGGDEPIVAHQWFGGRKRGLLAPFVVGTVDQLLMAALKTKHVHLRHLGLAGKVVVIDEVHAYDAYMSTYLDRVLFYLGAYGVPVLLLSATLPPKRRMELLKAYRGERTRASRRKPQLELAPRDDSGDPCYPLISYTSSNRKAQVLYKTITASEEQRTVLIDWIDDNDEALLQELQNALENGGCVGVLRNTVARAQSTYRFLRKNLDVQVVLAHSRFVSVDRAERDAWLSELLGPKSSERPRALVVVSTQVLEQSLDIDLDMLITDVAPVDLLLQRMGRLHRHHRGVGESQRPPLLREARCVITGVSQWNAEVPEFARGIDFVYQPAVLMRTICALRERMGAGNVLVLPRDIAPLVESVYEGEVSIPEGWTDAYAAACEKEDASLHDKTERASEWLLPKPGLVTLDGWMRNSVRIGTEAQGRAAVRDSEESIEVVVVQESKGELRLLPWVAEKLAVEANLGSLADTPSDDVARAAALCTVSLPPAMSAPYIADDVITTLSKMNPCLGWDESRWLSGMIPLVIDEQGEALIKCGKSTFHLSYTQETGLEIL
jgi:CRISPR-associated endonuclease/helicase Cas3